MTFRMSHAAAVLPCAVAIMCIACSASAADSPPLPGDSAGAAAMRVYIDPVTGKPAVPPPDAQVAPEAVAPRAVPSAPQQVPNPGPGGGFMLDTSGLGHEFDATIDASGKMTAECHPRSVAPAEEVKP